MSETAAKAPGSGLGAAVDPNRWKALAFIAIAQLMVVLDATIVNIALPSAQQHLGISDGNRQWVVTAYVLFTGGLLLLGGRLADLLGRRPIFLAGLTVFTGASLASALAPSSTALIVARAPICCSTSTLA